MYQSIVLLGQTDNQSLNYKMRSITILTLISITCVHAYNPCLYQDDGQLMNDFRSCSSYFECVSGDPQFRQCAEGRIFSQELQGCTRCYTCPKQGLITLPVPQSCTEYVICMDGTPFHRECPDGTHWNDLIGNCDLPEHANCIENVTPTPTGDPETTTYID